MDRCVIDGNPDLKALRWVRGVCILGSIGLTLLVCALIIMRIDIPFDNEWVESSIARSAQRVMDGESLYTPPSADYVGDNYPPLYFHLCAGLMYLFGPSLFVCRLVSVAAAAAVGLAIWMMGKRSSGDRWQRRVIVGLFVAFYAAGGQTYDLARVDMTALALAAWAIVTAVQSNGIRGAAISGLLMAMAILTKHNMLTVGAALGLGLWVVERRRGYAYAALGFGLPVLVFGVLQILTDGWSGFYLFTQPALHPFGGTGRWVRFIAEDVGNHGFLLAMGLGFGGMVLLRGGRWSADRRRTLLVLLVALGGLCATMTGRLKAGGFSNNLVPAWAFGLMALAWMLPRVRKWGSIQSTEMAIRIAWGFWLITAVQLSTLGSRFADLPWSRTLAYADRRNAADKLNALVERYSDDSSVWMPWHSFNTGSSNHYAHLCPTGFLVDGAERSAKSIFEADLADHLRQRSWSVLILNDLSHGFVSDRCTQLLKQGYEEVAFPIADPEILTMLTGKRTHPGRLFVRRNLSRARQEAVGVHREGTITRKQAALLIAHFIDSANPTR
ncbi:MAG: ArnT family glycosyltransferase [Phycisphaerae bacterium]